MLPNNSIIAMRIITFMFNRPLRDDFSPKEKIIHKRNYNQQYLYLPTLIKAPE